VVVGAARGQQNISKGPGGLLSDAANRGMECISAIEIAGDANPKAKPKLILICPMLPLLLH